MAGGAGVSVSRERTALCVNVTSQCSSGWVSLRLGSGGCDHWSEQQIKAAD